MMDNNLLLEIILVFILLILNGIFSAGEIAIVSSRKGKIREISKEKLDKRADILINMKDNPERFLSVVQIGITLFGTLASAIGGIIAIKYIKPLLVNIYFAGPLAESISLVIVVILLTYLFLVLGELVPKYIGIHYRESVALRIVPVFEFTSKVFFYLVDFLTFSTKFIIHSLNLKKGEDYVSESEIKLLLEEGRRKGEIDRTEEELIHGVFEFADRSVKDIMVPKPNVYAIDINDSKDSIVEYIVENEFSRYPVYRDHLDNIVGIAYHKDITRYIWSKESFDLQKLMKRPFFVPDTMGLIVLLKEMQRRRLHLAIVVDEYGTTIGIVTLEDIMEEIFGEIMDETDEDDRIERFRDGSFNVDASYSVRDLNNILNLNLPESSDYETLGGFILNQLQEIAKGGEIIYHGPYKLTVVGIEGRRITRIKIERGKKAIRT